MNGSEIIELMAIALLIYLVLDRFLPVPGLWQFPLFQQSASWNG
jgi:hypothetical protein